MEKLEIQINTAPYLFRYRPNNSYTIDEIENNYIFFPDREKLNDPFDANPDMLEICDEESEYEMFFNMMLEQVPVENRDYFKTIFLGKPKDLFHFVNNNKKGFISNFGIACFTMSEINLPLWANYASNHQGLCIQYNIDYDFNFFKGLRKVEYFEKFEKIKYYPASNPGGYQDILFKKFNLWRNEYELRLLKLKSGKYEHNPESIRNIIFGLRTPLDFKEKIIQIVKRDKYKHVKIYQPIVFSETFEIGFQQVII